MKKQTKRGRSVIRPLTVQLLIAAPVLTLLLCLAVARLILSGVVPEERITLCACAIAGITGFLLSLYCGVRVPQKRLLWGMVAAAGYALLLLIGNQFFSECRIPASRRALAQFLPEAFGQSAQLGSQAKIRLNRFRTIAGKLAKF